MHRLKLRVLELSASGVQRTAGTGALEHRTKRVGLAPVLTLTPGVCPNVLPIQLRISLIYIHRIKTLGCHDACPDLRSRPRPFDIG